MPVTAPTSPACTDIWPRSTRRCDRSAQKPQTGLPNTIWTARFCRLPSTLRPSCLTWDVVRARLKADAPGERPLVERLGWAGIEELFRQRRSLYAAAADFRLRASDLDVDQLAKVSMLRSLIWSRRRDGEER